MGVLRDSQDDAVVLLFWLGIVMIVAVSLAVGVLVSMSMGRALLAGRGKLFEEMMHSMRRGGG